MDVLFLKDLKVHSWPTSKNIKVKLLSVVQEPNILYFQEDKRIVVDFSEYVFQEVQRYCKSDIEKEKYRYYLPRTNEIILGLNGDNFFYRACVLNSSTKGIIVQFIDEGSMKMLSYGKCECFPASDRMAFEICAREYIVDNIPNKRSEKQEEILKSKTMFINNIYQDERDIFHCDIFGF